MEKKIPNKKSSVYITGVKKKFIDCKYIYVINSEIIHAICKSYFDFNEDYVNKAIFCFENGFNTSGISNLIVSWRQENDFNT